MASASAAPAPASVSIDTAIIPSFEDAGKHLVLIEEVFSGDAAKVDQAWKYLTGLCRTDSVLSGVVKSLTGCELDGRDDSVDHEAMLQALSCTTFPVEVVGDVTAAGPYVAMPMKWVRSHARRVTSFWTSHATVAADDPGDARAATEDEIFGGAPTKAQIAYLFSSEMHVKLNAALDDPLTIDAAWSKLFSAKKLSLPQRTCLHGLVGFKGRSTSTAARDDDRVGSPERKWNDLMARILVRLQAAICNVLEGRDGAPVILTGN